MESLRSRTATLQRMESQLSAAMARAPKLYSVRNTDLVREMSEKRLGRAPPLQGVRGRRGKRNLFEALGSSAGSSGLRSEPLVKFFWSFHNQHAGCHNRVRVATQLSAIDLVMPDGRG